MTFQGIRALLSTHLLLTILLLINVKADYQGEHHDPNKFLPQPANDINSLNILSSSRNLQETFTENCFQSQCQYVNALDQASINYNINIGSSAELNFEFATGMDAQQLTLSLFASNSAITQTSVNLSPPDPGTNGHLGTIIGTSWTRGLMLDSTANPNRTLLIQILGVSNNGSSTISFTIVSSAYPQQSTVVWSSNSGNNVWEVIVALVGGTIVLAFIIFCIHSVYSRRRITRARIRQMDRQAQFELALPDPAEEARNLTEEKIDERFPEAPFYTLQSSFPQKICSICLEELKSEQVCRQLYCEHIFHSECIQLWLANQLKKKFAFCPNCNMNMMVEPDIQHAPHINDLNHNMMHEQQGYPNGLMHEQQEYHNSLMQEQQGYHIHPAGSGNEI